MSRPGRGPRFKQLAPAALALGLACLAVAPASTGAAMPATAAMPAAAARASTSGQDVATAPALVAATLEQCLTTADQTQRSATFYGQMETIPGASRMAVQIDVQQHTPGDSQFHTLTAPGLDVWQRSETGVKIYKDVRQVTDLPAPALYRAVVQFRWLDEKGRVLKSTTRRTEICRQPAPRSTQGTVPATTTGTGTTIAANTPTGTSTDTATATGTTSTPAA